MNCKQYCDDEWKQFRVRVGVHGTSPGRIFRRRNYQRFGAESASRNRRNFRHCYRQYRYSPVEGRRSFTEENVIIFVPSIQRRTRSADHALRRGVAQPGRAPGSGPGGRRFKSSLPDHSFQSHKFNFWIPVYTAVDDFVTVKASDSILR